MAKKSPLMNSPFGKVRRACVEQVRCGGPGSWHSALRVCCATPGCYENSFARDTATAAEDQALRDGFIERSFGKPQSQTVIYFCPTCWIKKLTEALVWCGGSSDFAACGEARSGWRKIVEPLLRPTDLGPPLEPDVAALADVAAPLAKKDTPNKRLVGLRIVRKKEKNRG